MKFSIIVIIMSSLSVGYNMFNIGKLYGKRQAKLEIAERCMDDPNHCESYFHAIMVVYGQ